jgi:hypothetical protein
VAAALRPAPELRVEDLGEAVAHPEQDGESAEIEESAEYPLEKRRAGSGPQGEHKRRRDRETQALDWGGQLAGTVTMGACETSVSSASAMRSCTTVNAYLESKSESSIQKREER